MLLALLLFNPATSLLLPNWYGQHCNFGVLRRARWHCEVSPGRRQGSLRLAGHADATADRRGDAPRRAVLGALTTLPAAAAASDGSFPAPLVDIPLRRLRLPTGGLGGDYVLVPVALRGHLPEVVVVDFVLDSGLALEMVTPGLRERLRLRAIGRVEGSGAAGTAAYDVVELAGAAVAGLGLPPLHAAVADFPQAHLAAVGGGGGEGSGPKGRRRGGGAEGMLGMEFMGRFDVDVDFPSGRLRLWRRGDFGSRAAAAAGLSAVPAALLPGGVLGVRVAGCSSACAARQPFVGIVDLGSSFTILSKGAARLAGVDPEHVAEQAGRKPSGESHPPQEAVGVGIGGRPLRMPLVRVPLVLEGDLVAAPAAGGSAFFEPLARLPATPVAVADLPVFEDLLGGAPGFQAEDAAVLGVDVWSQGRIVFAGARSEMGKARGRERTIYWKGGAINAGVGV